MIELTGISLKLGGRQLLDSFELRLPDPGLYLFAGGNGSGKTVLARLLSGRLRPQRGQYRLDASEVYSPWSFSRPAIWYCDTLSPGIDGETLDNYMNSCLYDAGGKLEELKGLWPLLQELLDCQRDIALAELSSGQLALAQVALACLMPLRLIVLDGHFSLFDQQRSEQAAGLLAEHRISADSYLLAFATHFAVALPSAMAAYQLSGALPVSLSAADASREMEQGSTSATPGRRLLRVTLAGGREAGRAYQSGRHYMVKGLLERGLRIEVMGTLADVLQELEESGLAIRAIEWE